MDCLSLIYSSHCLPCIFLPWSVLLSVQLESLRDWVSLGASGLVAREQQSDSVLATFVYLHFLLVSKLHLPALELKC